MTPFVTCLEKVRSLACGGEANRLDEAKLAVDEFIASADTHRSKASSLHILERTIEDDRNIVDGTASGPFLTDVLGHIGVRFRQMREAQ